jgi:hypothetical protein
MSGPIVLRGLWRGAGRAFAVAAVLAAGCSGNEGAAGLNTGEAVAMPGLTVNLPPAPSFAKPDLPLSYPDGTMTVFGLRKQQDKYLGKEVKVKAYLVDMYVCPPCPKKAVCKLCAQPHFFLGDTANTKPEKALMVVDYLMPKQKPPALTVGKQYEIDGTFARNSPTGFAQSDGLLLFTKLTDDKGAEFLSPAAALEAKAKAGEAQEAAQMAKAAKTRNAALKK